MQLTIHQTQRIPIPRPIMGGTNKILKLSPIYTVAVLIIPMANLILLKMQKNTRTDNPKNATSMINKIFKA